MTTLAANDLEPNLLDELALISDPWTSLAKPFADAFKAACEAVAREHEGWVDPNRVRAMLIDRADYKPRQYAALWSTACARDGYLDKTDRLVAISGEGSKHNGGKSIPLRRWRGELP